MSLSTNVDRVIKMRTLIIARLQHESVIPLAGTKEVFRAAEEALIAQYVQALCTLDVADSVDRTGHDGG